MDAKTRTDPLATAALNRAGVARLDMVDLLRGLVIALMVLDHTRDYFHISAYTFDPTDPARTHLWLYLTRWVTHLCAPTFVFLAGVSIALQAANGKDPSQLTRFLLTRGAWLIALELTVIAFGFNFALPFVFLQVIWAIGVSMILLAGLIRLPRAVTAIIGVLIVAGHQLLAPIDPQDLGTLAPLWAVAFEVGPAPIGRGFVPYPAIPWFGVMCLGYALGPVFVQEPARRNRNVFTLAVGAIALFCVLRVINGYGDPAPWRAYPSAAATAMSFFNVSKYPPSLLYVLITLGVSLLCMLGLQRLRGLLARVLLAYGRTPLFTYVLHIYVVHSASLVFAMLAGYPASYHANFLADPFRLFKAGFGFNLLVVYVVWLAILVALYPASRWFAEVKRRRREWWLSYL
ncbi:MAG TPA: heparan-alpha-glucosaminide N-acetyltransferase domain-containing protein [Steroidobacteraceae bacterium]|nr:heparan-alpha-glucosaminide N-acetyltransferase domain-containing protein [Steroidobacteraceae bacterium]